MKHRWMKFRFRWIRFTWWAVNEWWGFWGVVLWQVMVYREAYYAYREEAWRKAMVAWDFADWLRYGGWKLRD